MLFFSFVKIRPKVFTKKEPVFNFKKFASYTNVKLHAGTQKPIYASHFVNDAHVEAAKKTEQNWKR